MVCLLAVTRIMAAMRVRSRSMVIMMLVIGIGTLARDIAVCKSGGHLLLLKEANMPTLYGLVT